MPIDEHNTLSGTTPDGSVGAASSDSQREKGGLGNMFLPPISAWVFVSILLWLFIGHVGATTLLGDGDTGWHIRAGEYVLARIFNLMYELQTIQRPSASLLIGARAR